MIIVKLQGGLGNQMFQYAAARGIAGKNPIYFDTEFLDAQTKKTPGFTPRKLELSIFKGIKIRKPNKFILHTLKGNKIFDSLLKRIFFNNATIIYQSEKNELIELNKLMSSTVYLDGYFQNERYFKTIREQLLIDFKFPLLTGYSKTMAGKIISTNNTVSIHIRRGDYLNPEITAYHGLLPLSYYKQAKTQIEAQISSPSYFIFSDDPEWCRANVSFFNNNSTIVSKLSGSTWEDMHLMSLCDHHIIANSSYSWWGAWLNKNPNKIVIAPDKWFASTITDIVPENWIKI